MGSFGFRGGSPAIRQATREIPWRCPWCGESTWFLSDGDIPEDRARVQMYCDSGECVSRETEIIITRGDGAHERLDVQALHRIDEGIDAGAPTGAKDFGKSGQRAGRVVMWREGQPAPYLFFD